MGVFRRLLTDQIGNGCKPVELSIVLLPEKTRLRSGAELVHVSDCMRRSQSMQRLVFH